MNPEISECSIRVKVMLDGAVLCRFRGGEDIIHRKGAGCRRENPVLMELTGEEVNALLSVEQMRVSVTLPRRTLFCNCALQCGPPPTRQDVLATRLRRAERALELAEERTTEAVAQFEWERDEAGAKGFYGQAFRDAQIAASDAIRRRDYARNTLANVEHALTAPALDWGDE